MVKPTKVTNSIRSLRFVQGEMTQAELASRIGVTRQTVIAIEKGRYSPSLEMAFRIAQALNVPLDDVFQYPAPHTDQEDKHMESEDRKVGRSQKTGRFVDEIRKLRGRPDTQRLVDGIDKLKDRPDTKRLVDEIDKLKDRPDTKRLVDEVDKLKDQ
jgi:putative transcriptional regulator